MARGEEGPLLGGVAPEDLYKLSAKTLCLRDAMNLLRFNGYCGEPNTSGCIFNSLTHSFKVFFFFFLVHL